MKIYYGFREDKQYIIQVIENNISFNLPHEKVLYTKHFCWGHGGMCASETSLAILSHCIGRRKAERLYHQFKWDIVAKLQGDWQINQQEIILWAKKTTKKLTEKRLIQSWI